MSDAKKFEQLGAGRRTVDYPTLGHCPPEKIFLVADMSTDIAAIALKQRGQKCDAKDRYKRLLRMFVGLKADMNEKHEFGMFVLAQHLVLVTALCSGSSVVDEIGQTEFVEISAPDETETGGDAKGPCDLTDVFEQIALSCSLPEAETEAEKPVPFVVRVILFYTRTRQIPEIRLTPATKKLFDHPFFFFDALFFHPPAKEKENSVDDINMNLQLMRQANGLILLASEGEVTAWHVAMGRLLQSPFLRQPDLEPDFTLKSVPSNAKNGKKPIAAENGENLIDLD